MSTMTFGRWKAMEGIPGIAAKGEIITVKPDFGIVVSRFLPLAKYPDLMLYRDSLSPLRPVPPEPRCLKVMD